MNLKVSGSLDTKLFSTVIDIVDETFDGTFKQALASATVYVFESSMDSVASEALNYLDKEGLQPLSRTITSSAIKDKEFVFCISNDEGEVLSFIIKVGVIPGNGCKTIPVARFLRRLVRVLQTKKLVPAMTRDEERKKIDEILVEIPKRVDNAEIVDVRSARMPPDIYT